jgi:endothelin-converting enzyme
MDEQNFNKVKAVYGACMDTELISILGAEPLLPVLADIASLFPDRERPTFTSSGAKTSET